MPHARGRLTTLRAKAIEDGLIGNVIRVRGDRNEEQLEVPDHSMADLIGVLRKLRLDRPLKK